LDQTVATLLWPLIVMCQLWPQAKSQAQKSRAKPRPCVGLMVAHGLACTLAKPELVAQATAYCGIMCHLAYNFARSSSMAPNNQRWPLLILRSAFRLPHQD
jgi:hypothetical protein